MEIETRHYKSNTTEQIILGNNQHDDVHQNLFYYTHILLGMVRT
jgi:hypothetical protein